MPTKKNSYISWIGENLIESAKNFESSLSNLLQVETKKISYILEGLDEASLNDDTDELCNINDMLCETLKYVENIQDVLSKKTLVGLYALNYDELKDTPSNISIKTDECELQPEKELDIVPESIEDTNTNNYPEDIINIDNNSDLLQIEDNLNQEDSLEVGASSNIPYEIIDLDIQLSGNGEIIINNIEDTNEPTTSNETYDYDQDLISKDKIIYPPANQKVSSNIINDENIPKKSSSNVKKVLNIIDDQSSVKPNTSPKVDVKFDNLIEIQIDTSNKYPEPIPQTKNIANDNITNKSINTIAEYTACKAPKDIELSEDEKSLVESFGFFKDYYKV